MDRADLFEQRLLLMGRISRLFRERGWELVVVGGSALEFYTEGQYLSGDIDVCRQRGQSPIPASVERDVMNAVGGVSTGTRRQWKVGDVFVDFLGEVETGRNPVFRDLETPEGPVRIMPAEDVLVERIFVAMSRQPPDTEVLAAARKMAAAAVAMGADFDWAKAEALAASAGYDIEAPFRSLVAEARASGVGPRSSSSGKP